MWLCSASSYTCELNRKFKFSCSVIILPSGNSCHLVWYYNDGSYKPPVCLLANDFVSSVNELGNVTLSCFNIPNTKKIKHGISKFIAVLRFV